MKIVAIGGGTGLSILLRGLKQVTTEITAVVTVADDGGGSGALRRDLGMLPPGDIRNCIVALANKEPILQDLLSYRFSEGVLEGQSFGNLMIAAMSGISASFEDAVRKVSDIFAISGRVLPVSLEDLVLHASLSSGEHVVGESQIPVRAAATQAYIREIWLEPTGAAAYGAVLAAIEEADAIILAPGSLYTSIIPNLLVGGITEAINQSQAFVFVLANLMTQRGETDQLLLREQLEALFLQTGLRHVTHWMLNARELPTAALAPYEKEGSHPLYATEADKAYARTMGVEVVEGDFAEVVSGYIRHDALVISERMAGIVENHVVKIYNKGT